MRLALLCLLTAALGCADADAPPATPPVPGAAPAPAEVDLPQAFGDLERRSLSTRSDAALGASVTETIALYGAENSRGEPSLEIYVTDFGDEEMAEMMGLGWGLRGDAADDAGTEVQASETFDGHPARRTWDTAARKGRLQVLADGSHFVEVRAEAVDPGVLDAAARAGLAAQ